jgi:hypothetical protein
MLTGLDLSLSAVLPHDDDSDRHEDDDVLIQAKPPRATAPPAPWEGDRREGVKRP